MRKLRLDLESLTVESFETIEENTSRGTVEAYDLSPITTGGPNICIDECSGSWCGVC